MTRAMVYRFGTSQRPCISNTMPTITTTTTPASTTTTVHAACTTITITSDAGVTTTTIASIPAGRDQRTAVARSPDPAARSRWFARLHPRHWLPRRRASPYHAPVAGHDEREPLASTTRMSATEPPPPASTPTLQPERELMMPTPVVSTSQEASRADAPPQGENTRIQPPGDTMVFLWREACAEYEQDTGHDLLTLNPTRFSSKDGILSFIHSKEDAFDQYRRAGPQKLRACLLPVVEVLGKLCEPVGGAVSIVGIPIRLCSHSVLISCRPSLPQATSSPRLVYLFRFVVYALIDAQVVSQLI